MVSTFPRDLAAGALALLVATGCGSEPDSNGGNSAGVGGTVATTGGAANAGATASGGTSQASGGTTGDGCTEPVTERRHPGVYDYKSCNECHTDMLGGWVYSNATGDAWVGGATVTLTNSDDSTLVATTAVDGFFHFAGATMATTTSFLPCVRRCADRTCATNQHTSLNCQTSNCHGGNDRLIYVTRAGASSTPTTGTNCVPAASGGPRMHYPEFDDQPCTTCHEADAGYIGGYVYDSVTGQNPVSMATVTLTPDGGSPINAVTGPGGMFHVTSPFSAPYTACISKCPDTVCSSSTSHSTTDDCVVCHNSTTQLRIHLP